MPSPNGAKIFPFSAEPALRFPFEKRNPPLLAQTLRIFVRDPSFTIKIARSKFILRIRYLNDFFVYATHHVKFLPCSAPWNIFDIAFQTMQIDWINLLVFRLFHLFNKYTNSNLPLPRLFSGKTCGKGGKEHIFSDK